MSVIHRFAQFLKDPPPDYIFELSEEGIALARRGRPLQLGFRKLSPGVIEASPLKDNVLKPGELAQELKSMTPEADSRKRRRAALILPDYCGRVVVLDFDAFPSDHQEQLSLVRFRIKKSVPFDVEEAAISFYPQPVSGNGKKYEVVAAVLSLEILARYEAPFRSLGFHPGFVTLSPLAGLELVRHSGIAVMAKRNGRALSVSVLHEGRLKLMRSVELDYQTEEEMAAVLYPTFAFVEDEMGARPNLLVLAGFGPGFDQVAPLWQAGLDVPVEPARSRHGIPLAANTGLLGYLESVEV